MDVVERLTLEAARSRSLLACTHVHRYRFAAAVCAGRRTVDLCCGSGYGSDILGDHCPEVLGVDVDAATIDIARTTVGRREGVRFVAADAVEFLRSGGADGHEALVCFEGVEHVPDLEGLLLQVERLMAGGTVVVLSVPNSRAFEEENEFHATDFGAEEFDALVARFPGARVLRQYNAEGSVILADGEPSADGRVVLRDRAEPDWANHFLVVLNAPDGGWAEAHAGLVQVEAAPLHNRYVRDLEAANARLARENARLLRGRLGHHAAAAGTRIDRLASARERIAELEDELGRLRAIVPFLAVAHGSGWHDVEEDESGRRFRWTSSHASLVVGADGVRRPPLRLVFEGHSFLRPRVVTVHAAGAEIGRAEVAAGAWGTVAFDLPAGQGPATVTLGLEPGADRAALVNPEDHRELGLALSADPVLLPLW